MVITSENISTTVSLGRPNGLRPTHVKTYCIHLGLCFTPLTDDMFIHKVVFNRHFDDVKAKDYKYHPSSSLNPFYEFPKSSSSLG